MSQDSYQAEIFANRLLKRYKHLAKWAKRQEISCFRLFDNDIPEIPLACDFYRYEDAKGAGLCMSLYERPYDKPAEAEEAWLRAMAEAASKCLELPLEEIYVKVRKRQRGLSQYNKIEENNSRHIVRESGLRFIVNLSDYLDTGLFLDHRITRELVRARAQEKRVLNLFCYTASFSVYAADGGAESVESVDLSNSYLDWAKENMRLNYFTKDSYSFVKQDVIGYLEATRAKDRRFDLIVLDPPTFSNSKAMQSDLDLNRNYPDLVGACLDILEPSGFLYFSYNSRRLKFDPGLFPQAICKDISAMTISEDFRDKRIHQCWELQRSKL
jgi:23S rRNA G2069 N7-methylase RlmK/C1962 C5-methylase RlmI